MYVSLYCPRPSTTCRSLATALGLSKLGDSIPNTHAGRLLRLRGGNYTVINWGSSSHPWWDIGVNWVNHPDAVRLAISKYDSLTKLKDDKVKAVLVTRDRQRAIDWQNSGHRVITRRDGLSAGVGIRDGVQEFVRDNEFYARVFPKTHEFRVHVFGGEVIDFTEKKLSSGAEPGVDRLIRSHANGWVFCHENLSVVQEDINLMGTVAKRAVASLGLDFGAVDMLAALNHGTPRRVKSFRVCEINTAPGIANQSTFDSYCNAIVNLTNRA